MGSRFWFVGSCVLVLAAVAAARAATSAATGAALQEPEAIKLLEGYERGEYDTVLQSFATSRTVDGLRKDLEKSALKWTMAAGSASEPRRRLVAATMALELANARLEDEWATLRSLVEWGCELLQRGAPTEAERTWQLASMALAGGALDSGVLFKLSGPTKSYGHLAHVRSRFPDEPRFLLAERFAVVLPNLPEMSLQAGFEPDADSTTPYAVPGGRILVLDPSKTPDPFASEEMMRRARADARTRLEAAVKRLREVFDDPAIGAEAALRAGHLMLIGLELAQALEAFRVAARNSATPYVTYLAHFLRGRVLERMARPEEAERAYAAAADTIPLAQSAALARSALLMRVGRSTEAHALARASFDARLRPPDPWRLFPYGDYYRWPALIAELRQAVRQ